MRPYPFLGLAITVGLGSLAGCSGGGGQDTADAPVDCTMETRADTFVVGLEKMGQAGAIDFKLMSADPAPPARGNNTWVVQLNAMSSGVVGNPVTGASLAATPYMPDHGHGTPINVTITEQSTPGQYKLDPVNLWMPGYWETTVQAQQGTTTDTAVFKFCIPE